MDSPAGSLMGALGGSLTGWLRRSGLNSAATPIRQDLKVRPRRACAANILCIGPPFQASCCSSPSKQNFHIDVNRHSSAFGIWARIMTRWSN